MILRVDGEYIYNQPDNSPSPIYYYEFMLMQENLI